MTKPDPTNRVDEALTDERGESYFLGGSYGPEDAAAHARLMEWMASVSQDEFLESLVAAGIYAPDGTLLPPYAGDDVPAEDASPSGHGSAPR